jgi:molybdopterin-guanine dinucleotide biosynthesis protein A
VTEPAAGAVHAHAGLADAPGVVVLAGGRSSRFGADKVALLLDRVLAPLSPAWRVVCVGPDRPTHRPVVWTREQPAWAGPLAGVGAGLAALPARHPLVLVLAADMPHAALAVPALVEACRGRVDAACVVDADGFRQPLLACYRRRWLDARLSDLAELADRPARLLLADAKVAEVADRWDAAVDVDEPGDLPVDD